MHLKLGKCSKCRGRVVCVAHTVWLLGDEIIYPTPVVSFECHSCGRSRTTERDSRTTIDEALIVREMPS